VLSAVRRYDKIPEPFVGLGWEELLKFVARGHSSLEPRPFDVFARVFSKWLAHETSLVSSVKIVGVVFAGVSWEVKVPFEEDA
jgi:hypothetical protein